MMNSIANRLMRELTEQAEDKLYDLDPCPRFVGEYYLGITDEQIDIEKIITEMEAEGYKYCTSCGDFFSKKVSRTITITNPPYIHCVYCSSRSGVSPNGN